MLNPKIRFVIAGTGTITPVHADAIRRVKGAELVAFFGSDKDRVERLGRKYGIRGYNDWGTLCQSEQFDAVDVATHSGRHAWVGMEAALKGKHLLVEKPITTTLEEGEQLVASCERAGITLGVIYQHRFDPDIQQVKQWIENGELGDILWVSASLMSSRDLSYYRLHDGRSDPRLTGGGVLINQGIHVVDILQWLLGPVQAVSGHTENRFHLLPFEDTAVGLLQFVSGTFATCAVTTACRISQPSWIEIQGREGSAVLENFKLKRVVRKGKPLRRWEDVWKSAVTRLQRDGSHEDVLQDFVEALRKGRPSCVDGYEALRSLKVVLALYASAKAGETVFLDHHEAARGVERIAK